LLALFQSLKTEVALLYGGVLFGSKLGCVPGAGIEAKGVTFFVTQALLPVYHHDAIGFPFGNSLHRAGKGTGWIGTLIAEYGQIGNEKIGKLAVLNDMYLHPVDRPGIDIMPVLAGYGAGVTAGAARLV